ncbi:MAG: hypothetical protein H6568_03640 [Lewinellaceae bacterium]|nr:hypothetical protein [Lewinellaceae bacterium]
MYRWLLLLLLPFLGCVGQRQIYPLPKGEHAVGVQAGGPLIRLNQTTLPIPLSAVYGAVGLGKGLLVDGGIHTTALLYQTIFIDPGVQKTWNFPNGLRPGLNTGLRLNTLTDLGARDWRFYPLVDVNLWWRSAKDHHIGFVGLNHWFDPHVRQIKEGITYRLWRPALYTGYQHRREDWDFSLEAQWLAPGTDNRFTEVDYRSIGDQGALGIYLTIQYRFL